MGEKLSKGCEMYCHRSRRSFLTGGVAAMEVLGDFRITYSVIGFCGVDRRTCPLFGQLMKGRMIGLLLQILLMELFSMDSHKRVILW